MSNHKTIRELLNELPKDIRDKAMDHIKNQENESLLNLKKKNMSDAVSGIFLWPFGEHEYWLNVSKGIYPTTNA